MIDWSFSFFFFKQKTAYEMRISDWSSDVCSSDLIGELLGIVVAGGGTGAEDQVVAVAADGVVAGPARRDAISPAILVDHLEDRMEQRLEIGRASGRERVCQYV